MGDVRVDPDRVDGVQCVRTEAREDVGQPGRHATAGHDATARRHGSIVPVELLEGLRVVRAEIDEVDAGGDRGVGDPDVVAHVGRVEDDLGVGEGRCERRRILDIDGDHAFRCAEPAQQGGGGRWPDVADRDLVIGPLDEIGDRRRPHLARPAEDQDAAHPAVAHQCVGAPTAIGSSGRP